VFDDTRFRACFDGSEGHSHNIGKVKSAANGRLNQKTEFYLRIEERFEEDVKSLRRIRNSTLPKEVSPSIQN
jgi:hypothetical protein